LPQTLTLQDLSAIYSGYSFRGKVMPHEEGDYYVVQGKDLDNNQELISDSITLTKLPGRAPKETLQKNDIIFLARGGKNFASLIPALAKNSVACQYFFHLRIKSKVILPEFLYLQINSQTCQRYLDRSAQSVTVRSVSRKVLEEMPISVPALEKQKEIIKLAQLAKREEKLLNRKIENNKRMLEAILEEKMK